MDEIKKPTYTVKEVEAQKRQCLADIDLFKSKISEASGVIKYLDHLLATFSLAEPEPQDSPALEEGKQP